MEVTRYFEAIRSRPDRAVIEDSWIERAIREMENRYLRVVLLEDGKTVHNAFFDRGFQP